MYPAKYETKVRDWREILRGADPDRLATIIEARRRVALKRYLARHGVAFNVDAPTAILTQWVRVVRDLVRGA